MSTYPNIPAGTILTSALLQSMLPQNAYKSGDQNAPSTTLVNDTALVVPLQANAVYIVEALIFYTAGTTGDFKYNFASPSGATSPSVAYLGQTTSLGVQQGTVVLGGAGAFGGNGASSVQALELKFTIATSSTTGNLTFQFAQNATDATATTVKAGSYLTARRIV